MTFDWPDPKERPMKLVGSVGLAQHSRLTIVHDESEDSCECGKPMPCNLACIFGEEKEKRKSDESLKLLGRMELEPGEYIHDGKVWYCADQLSAG